MNIEYDNKIKHSFAIIGFMGSGKSSTSKKIAKHFGGSLFSLDYEIQKETNLKLNDLFKLYGEPYFRKLEYEMLCKYLKNLKSDECCIFDLGGGTFMQKGIRELLKKHNIITIFLNVPFYIINNRLKIENRPLLENSDIDAIESLFKNRYYIYKKKCDICVEIKKREYLNEVSKKVINIIYNYYNNLDNIQCNNIENI